MKTSHILLLVIYGLIQVIVYVIADVEIAFAVSFGELIGISLMVIGRSFEDKPNNHETPQQNRSHSL